MQVRVEVSDMKCERNEINVIYYENGTMKIRKLIFTTDNVNQNTTRYNSSNGSAGYATVNLGSGAASFDSI